MHKRIMIIGAGEMQVPVILKAKNIGLYVVTIDGNIKAPGNKYADVALEIDTNDKFKILKAAKDYEIDGLLTTSDLPVRVVAFVSQELGLKGLSVSAAEITTNKYLLRKKLQDKGIISPLFFKLACIEDIDKLKKRFIFPMIIKPVDSSASRGVKKVNSLVELYNEYPKSKEYSHSGIVIIEEFINGNEYSVESLIQNGKLSIIAITEKKVNGNLGKYFVEERHIIPANLSKLEQEEILKTVTDAVKVIGLDNCASHTELMLTKKGAIIIEIGARLGGDYITSDLVPLAYGVDMLRNIINISLGKGVDINKTKSNFSGVQFINSKNYTSSKNYIKSLMGNEDLEKYEIKEYQDIKLTNSMNRLGYFICKSNTREGLIKMLNIKE